jgi:hypothetical protein
MRHVWNIGSLASLDVDDTRIVDCARKSATQVELLGLIAIWFFIPCCHRASM